MSGTEKNKNEEVDLGALFSFFASTINGFINASKSLLQKLISILVRNPYFKNLPCINYRLYFWIFQRKEKGKAICRLHDCSGKLWFSSSAI